MLSNNPSVVHLMIILSLLIWLLAVTVAITIHEFAHALAADKLGDPTPSLQDRLSLNPLNHYDQVGTTMLLVTSLMRALGAPVIPLGWAKPVEYDPYNLAHPKRDSALIALAGPAANLILAIILSVLLKQFFMELPLLNILCTAMITLNVSLAIFNLIPIHPLDGSKIIVGLLPNELGYEYQIVMHRYGFLLLIFLILPFAGTSALTALISPVVSSILNWLL